MAENKNKEAEQGKEQDLGNEAQSLTPEEMIKKLQEKNAALKAENEEHEELEKELMDKVAEKEAEASVKRPIKKVGKKKYAIMGNVRINGRVVKASELNADQVKKLLEKGSELVKQV